MKIRVKAKISVEVEKTIEAPSMEEGLARARRLGFRDLLWVGSNTTYFTDSVKVAIKGVGESR